MGAQLLRHVWFFATPWTVARQALRSMGCTNNLNSMKLFYEKKEMQVYPEISLCWFFLPQAGLW